MRRRSIPFTLLLIAVLMPGPPSPAAQESPSRPPGSQESTAVPLVKQPRPATKKPVWTLDQLVKKAVSANPETMSKRASLEAAEASVDAAFQQFFPSPYAKMQQGYEQDNNQSTDSSERVGIFGLQQPIWTGGKLTADLNVAKASALSVDSSITETQLSLAQRVVAAYQNLMMYHQRIQAQTDGIELLENYAAMMDRRVQSSVSAAVDQVLINSRISQAHSDLSTFTNGQQTALAQLGQLVGQPLKAGEVEFDTATALSAPQEPDEVIRQGLQTNPTLRRMDADINTVVHQEEKQRAALMPTLSVKAEYQNGLFDQNSTDDEDTRIYTTLDFSPGAGLSSLANIRSATARISATKQAKKAAQRDLIAKIQADYEDCQNAYTRQRLIGKTVHSSREVLESYTRLFVAGKRSWLDVLNSARELTQNELILADVLAVYQASSYRLRLHAGDADWLQKNNQLRKDEGPDSSKIEPPAPVKVEQPGIAAKDEPQKSPNADKIKKPTIYQRVKTLFTVAEPESKPVPEPEPNPEPKPKPAKLEQPRETVIAEGQDPAPDDSNPAAKEQCIGIGCPDAKVQSRPDEEQRPAAFVRPESVMDDRPGPAVKAKRPEPAQIEYLPSMEDQCLGVGCPNADSK